MRILFAAVLLAALLIGVPSCEAARRPLATRKASSVGNGRRQAELPSPPSFPPPPPPHPAFSDVCKKFNFTTYNRVTSDQELRQALKNAKPGDMIEVMPGSYWIRTPGGGGSGGSTLLPQIPDDGGIEIDVPDADPSPMVPAKPAQGNETAEASPAPAPAPAPKPAAKPKPAPALKPKPAPALKPKPAPALKPKPAPAAGPSTKPKPAPATKPKPAPATKPKPAPGPENPKPSPSPSSPVPDPAPAPGPEAEPVNAASAPAPSVSSLEEEDITMDATTELDTYTPKVATTTMSIKSEDAPLTSGGGGAPMLANGGTIFQLHGEPDNLITICGTPENTTFEGTGDLPNSWRGYSIRVVSSSYIRVAGFNLVNALKGIDIQNTTNSEFMYLNTNNTMQEGIRLRYNSSNNTVEYNNISYTGRIWAGWGEGIYVGTSKKNSIEYNLPEDHSDFNAFRYNRFGAGVLAENIDVKEFTFGGKIVDNRFNGSAIQNINGAMSWVSLKGNNWTVYNNTGTGLLNVGAGFRVLVQWDGEGQSNRLLENTCYNLDQKSYCVYIHPDAANNVVACTNTVNFWPGANSTEINPPECNCVRDCSVVSYYKPSGVATTTTTTTTGGVVNQVMGTHVKEPRFNTASTGAPVVTASWSVPGLDGNPQDERRPSWD